MITPIISRQQRLREHKKWINEPFNDDDPEMIRVVNLINAVWNEVQNRKFHWNDVIQNVVGKDKNHQFFMLNDEAIFLFLQALENDYEYNIYSPGYFTCLRYVKPSETLRDIQIMGGTEWHRHWCCMFYNGSTVEIYDSLQRLTYEEFPRKNGCDFVQFL